MVDVICYGKRETWKTREAAFEFFWKGVFSCEGSERDRYLNIVTDLANGKDVCSDGEPERRYYR